MNYDNYYKNGGMTKEESVSAIALRIGAKKEAVAKFVEKNNIDTNKLNSDLKSGQVYFLDVITAIVGKPNNKYEKEIIKKYGNKMAMGGKTQGYDDREDERLGMEYGKMSGKDFDGSHDMREHSRRDDARFEERMAMGGEIGNGKNGYVAFYKGKKIVVHADSIYEAQKTGAKYFKAKKEYEVNVMLAELDGKQYIQSTAFAKGGEFRANNSSLLRYANFDDDSHINLVRLNPIKTSGLPYKNINKFAISIASHEDGQKVMQFKTLDIAESKFEELVDDAKRKIGLRNEGKTSNYSDSYADGGHIVEHDKMYNFLEDDLQNLQNAIEGGDFEEVNRFFSYWGRHLKSLETKTNERMYNFLQDDLEKLQTAIEEGDTEEVSKFFSYWNQHLQSLKMADGGETERKAEAIKTAVEIATMAYKNGVRAYDMDFEDFSERIFYISKTSYPIVDLRLAYNALLNSGYKNGGMMADGGMMGKGGEIADIEKIKKSLISKAKAKGIYENFGQKEVRQLEDKYGSTASIQNFDNWVANFDLSQMADGGMMADGGEIPNTVSEFENKVSMYYAKMDEAEKNYMDDDGASYHKAIEDRDNYILNTKKAWYENLSEAEKNGNSKRYEILLKMINDAGLNKYAKGGLLEEGDYVWNAVGKKLVVNKVTDDEYFLSAFGQIGDSPFSKQKVEMYLKNGQWSRKPKMAKGGAIENQYEGRTPEDIWDSLDSDQRYHFIDDHALQIEMLQDKNYDFNSDKFPESISNNLVKKSMRSDWENLDEVIQNRFANHVRQGEYAKGGAISEQNEMNKKVLALVQKAKIDSKLEFGQLVVSALTDANAHSEVRKFISIIEKKPEWAEEPKDIDYNLPDEEFEKQRAKTVYGSKYYDADKKINDLAIKIANMFGWDFEGISDSLIFASKMSGRNDVAQVLEKLNTDDDKQDATKNKWEYTDKDEIEYVVVKDKSKKEIKFDGKDVISGVHDLLEKGGKLTEIGKYYSKNDVVSVFVNGKNILDKNTVSGVWIKKDAKPMAGGGFVVVSENDGYWYIMSKPTSKQVAEEFLSTLTIPRGEVGKVVSVEDAKNHKKVIGRKYLKMADGGDVSEMKIGQTTVRKGFNGWVGKTMVDNFKGYDWDITTIKNSRGDLTTTAQGGKSEDKGGYKMFTFMLFQDPSVRLQTSRPARVNEKVVSEQHAEALKIFKEKVGNTPDKEKMADGGAIGFDALAKKVAKNYEGDKVKKQYQDEYGKTYDKKEAEEVGKKVAGKVYGQQQAKKKMAKGGKVAKKSGSPANRSQSKMTLISRKASEIRKANEPWRDAFNRAKAIIG